MNKRLLSMFFVFLMIFGGLVTTVPVSAELSFNDTDSHWGKDAIEYVVENGLMNGVGDGTSFAPDMNLTRGMVVTVLYRDNGAPNRDFKGTFLDVTSSAYYTAAAEWAYENGIVNGTGTDDWGEPYFSPDRDITRQELATMFKRYADFKHVDTTKGATDIATFPDASSVASWASDAVKWSVGVGLITGKSNGGAATLSPTDKAVRAEFATIIKRFKKADFEYELFYAEPVPKSTFTQRNYPLVNDADIYVAVDGNDNNDGSLNKPLATFAAAKAKVREIKASKNGEIKVAFKAGDYGPLDMLYFSSDDSGKEGAPITYCAYGDGDVLFTGGIKLTDKMFSPVDDSDKHLLGKVDTSKVYKIDLNGILDTMTRRNIVFSETGICHEARIPNKNGDGTDRYYSNVTTTVDERASIELQNYLPDIVKELRTTEGMYVTGFLRAGWLVDTFKVKDFDVDKNIITFDFDDEYAFSNGYTLDEYPLMYEGRTDDKIFFHNLSDQIDDKGEYWFDNDTKILYMYEPEGEYYISTDGTFLDLSPANYLNFKNLKFIATTDNAIVVQGKYITFDGCTFGNVAGEACLKTYRGSDARGLKVLNCEFYNFRDCGIFVYSSEAGLDALTPSEIVIDNNYFHDFTSAESFGSAISINWTVDAVVSHNEFVNGGHSAIDFDRGINLTIEYNVFDNMMMNSADYGAVYSFRLLAFRDNTIRYNIFKNIRAESAQYGIYIDGSYAQNIYGNIFYDAGTRGIVINGGRENNVHDNVFIGSNSYNGSSITYNSDLCGIDENGMPFANNEEKYDITLERLGMAPDRESPHFAKWYAKWPILYDYSLDFTNIDSFDCIFNTVNEIKNNAFFNVPHDKTDIHKYFADETGNKDYTLNDNPIFTDPTHGDYSIKDTSRFFDNHFDKIGRY